MSNNKKHDDRIISIVEGYRAFKEKSFVHVRGNEESEGASFIPKINKGYCGIEGNKDVLDFIENFLAHQNSPEAAGILAEQFAAGYCYHFAMILKGTFNRGEICLCAPYGHVCWVDHDGVPYDIYGICTSEAENYIPVSFAGKAMKDFLHAGEANNTSEEQIEKIMNRYLVHKYKGNYKVTYDASRTFKTTYVFKTLEDVGNHIDDKTGLHVLGKHVKSLEKLKKPGGEWYNADADIKVEYIEY